MAQRVGDLWPFASGTSSLGAEMQNGGFTGAIVPFGHVHMNSGVWHRLSGGSGVMRYGSQGLEFSNDGGITFYTVISSGLITLQGAYDGGKHINQEHRPAPSYLLTNALRSQHDPVVVGHNDPGAGNSAGYELLSALRDASIVASGFSLTPNLVNTFAFTAILPGTLAMQASGTASSSPPSFQIACSDLAPAVLATASGSMIWNTTGPNGSMTLLVSGNGDLYLLNNGDGTGQGGQIKFEPFASSGALEYRLGGVGGHEAWHWKPSYVGFTGGPNNDGYFPIPHSGQILAMILQNAGGGSTLQAAYEANNAVFTSAAQGGPVNLMGVDTYALGLYAATGGSPHAIMSGVPSTPASNLQRGALWMQAGAGTTAQLQGNTAATTQAGVSARSLGIETLFYHAGTSGIAYLRTGSGIAQFFNAAASAAIDDVGLNVPLNVQTSPDSWYGLTNASGIRPWVAGKYRITYTAVLEKTLGNLAQVGKTELRFYDKNGNQFRLLCSNSAALLRDSNTLNLNSANGQWMGDLREGISVFLFVNATEAPPADNSFRARARNCNVIMEWIGPLSDGQQTIQKVT